MFKFIFVMGVGALVVFISLFSFFSKDNDEDLDDMFYQDEDPFDVIFPDEDANDNKGIEDPEDKEEDISLDEPMDSSGDIENMEQHNEDKFGADKVRKAEKIAEDVTTMWLEHDDNFDKWEGVSTPSFFNVVKENVFPDDAFAREVDYVETFILADQRENEMTIEARVLWYFTSDGDLHSPQKQLLYITFDMSGDDPLVDMVFDM